MPGWGREGGGVRGGIGRGREGGRDGGGWEVYVHVHM